MIPDLAMSITSRSLPPLRGGLLSMYRAAWFALAATATGILLLSMLHPAGGALIVGLRLLKAAIVMTVATILFRRRQHDAVAALLSLVLLLWTITSSFDFASSMTGVPMILDRLRFLLFTIALLLFPNGEWCPRWGRGIAVASVVVFAIGTAEALHRLPTHSFLPLAIPCVIAAIATLIIRFRTASAEAERLQLKWVALGLTSGVGCILAARAGFALMMRMDLSFAAPLVFEALFQCGIVLVALGFLVSLLRYRLFDVETAVTRSAAYGGLTLALLATFAGTEATIENVGQAYLGMGLGNVSAAMAAAVAAVLLNPLHDRISRWAEQYFQRDLVLLKQDLPEMLEDLAATATPAQLATAILPRINAAIHATRSVLLGSGGVAIAADGVLLKDVRRWLRQNPRPDNLKVCDRHDPLFPIRLPLSHPASGAPGWILLGPRPDGSLYGREELGAVESLRPTVRRALLWVITREASHDARRRERRALHRELAELRDRLDRAGSGKPS
jgi:hypothetical protein